jgi:hypothetical protein
MRSRDPFLNQFGILVDRLSAWLILVLISTLLLWSCVWHTAVGYSNHESFALLLKFITVQADRVTVTVGILILSNAVLGSSLISVWLFNRWRRSSELRSEHIRGSRLVISGGATNDE